MVAFYLFPSYSFISAFEMSFPFDGDTYINYFKVLTNLLSVVFIP